MMCSGSLMARHQFYNVQRQLDGAPSVLHHL
jgi:hypothetical protein